MDDPLVPKRLDEAITMVGTCVDMCPRFERYRRERENNLFNWEVVRIRLVFHSRGETYRLYLNKDSRNEARGPQACRENVRTCSR